jgi:hypothetical protein
MKSMEEIIAVVREEVAFYALREFSDTDNFMGDVDMLGDDLTEIILTVESRLGVQLDRRQYRKIHNVSTWANALHERLSTMEHSSGVNNAKE